VDGDYGPTTPRSPNRRHSPMSPTASTPSGHDEFSMPEEYDTVIEDQGSLYSKWSQSINVPRFGRQNAIPSVSGSSGMISPSPGSPRKGFSSPRRTTATIGGGGGGLGDEWSLASFDVQSPSARQMYRDFNGSATGGSTSDSRENSRENNTIPPATTTTTSSSWWGLSIPKFT
jgi:hypothetical protein